MRFALLLCGLFLAVVLQEFIPPVSWLQGARVPLMTIVFFYGALALPFPWMLALAVAAGLMWDLTIRFGLDSTIENSLGWSIVALTVLGSLVHGMRPMFRNGRWEIHCLASGFGTALFILFEYLMISFRRQGIHFEPLVWWRIGGAGVLALFLSPAVYFLFRGWNVLLGARASTREVKAYRF